MTKAEYIEQIITSFSVLKRCLHSQFNDNYASLDLSMPQLQTMMAIAHHSSITQSELASRLKLSAGAVSQIVDSLAGKALIERERGKDDRRLTFISLSAQGEDKIKRLRERGQAIFAKTLEGLSVEELKAFHDVELKLINNINGDESSK